MDDTRFWVAFVSINSMETSWNTSATALCSNSNTYQYFVTLTIEKDSFTYKASRVPRQVKAR